MNYLCLDFEGVLIPEIWQYVAEATDSKDLISLSTKKFSKSPKKGKKPYRNFKRK